MLTANVPGPAWPLRFPADTHLHVAHWCLAAYTGVRGQPFRVADWPQFFSRKNDPAVVIDLDVALATVRWLVKARVLVIVK